MVRVVFKAPAIVSWDMLALGAHSIGGTVNLRAGAEAVALLESYVGASSSSPAPKIGDRTNFSELSPS
jgi:hypothetical protein